MARLFDDTQSEFLDISTAVRGALPTAISCWVRGDDSAINSCPVWFGDKDVVDYWTGLYLTSGGKVWAYSHKYGSAAAQYAEASANWSQDTWHHVVGVWLSASERHVYIDGGNKGSNTGTVGAMANHDRFGIGGALDSSPDGWFSGNIAEVGLWNLTSWGANDAEREANFEYAIVSMAKGYSPKFFPLGMYAYWPLVDHDRDVVGGNNLTANNTPSWDGHCRVLLPSSALIGLKTYTEVTLQGSTEATTTVSGSLGVGTELQGSTEATTNVSGVLKSADSLIGSIAGTAALSGHLSINLILQCITAETSNVSGSLDIDTVLQGSADSAANVSGVLLFDISLKSSCASTNTVAGSLSVETELQGITEAVSNVSGALGSIDSFIGSIAETSNVSGSLDSAPTLQSVVAETSNISGVCNVDTELQSSVSSVISLTCSLSFLTTRLQGEVDATTTVSGSLDVETELQGSTEATTNVSGVLKSADLLIGLIASNGIVSGSLNVTTKLQGSTESTSNVLGVFEGLGSFVGAFGSLSGLISQLSISVELIGNISSALIVTGELNVDTQLQSTITDILWNSTEYVEFEDDVVAWQANAANVALATSGVTGWLGFWIFLASSISSTSTVSGSLDRQPGLVGVTVGASSGSCYLSITPDFEATTLVWRSQSKIVETLEWNTSILKAFNGTEQRIKIRHAPRQHFKLRIFLSTDKLNSWYDSLIHTWQKQAWLLPIWNEYVEHTADISKKDTTITVDTTFADFRASNKAIVWKSATEYEVLAVGSKTDTQLSLSYAVLNNFTGSKYIMPVRTAYLTSHSKKTRSRYGQAFVDLVFSVYDNTNLTDYVKTNEYDNITLLIQPAFMDDTYSEDSDADITISDYGTGIFKAVSNSDFNILTQSHKFFNDTKEACWNFRQFLHSLNGRQKTIIIPTFRNDVTQTDDIEVTDTAVVIQNIDLATNMDYNELRTYIGFYFTDETLIVRKITGITRLSSAEEQIDFDYNLDLSSAVESGDCRICFVDRCRLASDKIELIWDYAHRNECNTNFVRVK